MFRIALIVALFFSLKGNAQSFNELWNQKDKGVGINIYQFEGYTVEDSIYTGGAPNYTDTLPLLNSESYGISVFTGWNFPIVPVGNDFSIGINPNIALGVGLSGGFGLFLETPIYLTLKYGTDAVWNKSNTFKKKVGFALGFGAHGVVGYTAAPISTTGVEMAYLRPTFMSEFSFVTNRETVHKIRFHMNIGNSRMWDYTETVGYPAKVAYTQFGISYIKTFYGL